VKDFYIFAVTNRGVIITVKTNWFFHINCSFLVRHISQQTWTNAEHSRHHWHHW